MQGASQHDKHPSRRSFRLDRPGGSRRHRRLPPRHATFTSDIINVARDRGITRFFIRADKPRQRPHRHRRDVLEERQTHACLRRLHHPVAHRRYLSVGEQLHPVPWRDHQAVAGVGRHREPATVTLAQLQGFDALAEHCEHHGIGMFVQPAPSASSAAEAVPG